MSEKTQEEMAEIVKSSATCTVHALQSHIDSFNLSEEEAIEAFVQTIFGLYRHTRDTVIDLIDSAEGGDNG